MPRYEMSVIDGQRYYPLPYDALRVGERGEPATPLVPYYDCVDDALVAIQQDTESRLAPLRQMIPGTSAEQNATYVDKLANPTIFFRGQDNLNHRIVPTRFRLTGVADPAASIAERIRVEEERAAAIRRHCAATSDADLTELQSRAVARHFGAPSTLVDLTFDPAVAAAFAQPRFSERESRAGAPLGLIYAIDMGQLQDMFGMMAWAIGADGAREIHLVNVMRQWALPYLSHNADSSKLERQVLAVDVPPVLREEHARLRTCVVPGVSRIEAQRGLFLELALADPSDTVTPLLFWTLLDFLARKWCFRRADVPYAVREADGQHRDLFHEKDGGLEAVSGDP